MSKSSLLDGLAVVEWADATQDERMRVLSRGRGQHGMYGDEDLRKSIQSIVDDVTSRGDDALTAALERFDKVHIGAGKLKVTGDEFESARRQLDDEVIDAIRVSIARSRAFNDAVLERQEWTQRTRDDVLIGERVAPVASVGLFVPSGKGSFPSVAIQIGTPAVVARVDRIAVVLPPLPDSGGAVDPATLVALDELGLKEVYRSNGPAGMAALAVGTRTIPRVYKIVGPGSPAVAYAQMEVLRLGCAVEIGFGPTDSLIVADSTADPVLGAADLLNEAEHGYDSSAVLVSTDRGMLDRTIVELGSQIERLPEPRASYAASSILANGGVVYASSEAEAMSIANDYAPEHLQLAVADPERWLSMARYAGTALLGQWTTFAASNFSIRTPATLPTTGFAKVASPQISELGAVAFRIVRMIMTEGFLRL